jgi:hypothetical protein
MEWALFVTGTDVTAGIVVSFVLMKYQTQVELILDG